MILSRHSGLLAPLVVVLLAAPGCASNWAFRQGKAEAKKRNWDMAVARFTKALDQSPDDIEYRIALDHARAEACRAHYTEAMKHLTDQDLEKAKEELEIATKFDGANRLAAERLADVERRIAQREEESRRRSELETATARTQVMRVPTPALSPRSTAPISLKFLDKSLQTIFDSLGKLAGVNVIMDPDFRDKKVNFDVTGITFEEALNQLCLLHHLFYKVIDQNTIAIANESPQQRRKYDDLIVQTFYLRNTESKDVIAVVKGLITGGSFKVVDNPTLGAVNVTGTPDQVALAGRIIEANDKPRGEVVVEIRIMEISRNKARAYGIALSNYTASVAFAPFANPSDNGTTQLRAHLLSSINLSDFVVSLPSTVLATLSENHGVARILASPRLRASEGKVTSLKVGKEIAIPTTTFTSPQVNTVGGVGNATSFTTRTIGVNMDITPKISAGGEITLEIAAEFSDEGILREVSPGLKIPDILTRNMKGILRLRDGETSMIGGLRSKNEKSANAGMMGVSEVPLLNRIFGAKTQTIDESEVVITITPRIVRAPIVNDDDLRPMAIGTDEVKRFAGLRPPLLGLAEPTPLPSPSPAPRPTPTPSAPATSPAAAPATSAAPAPPPAAPGTSPAATPSPSPAPLFVPSAPKGDDIISETGPGPSRPPGAAGEAMAGGPGAANTAAAGARPPRAQFMPMALAVKPGEIGSVSVVLVGARDLLAVELVLSYDPSVITAMELASGGLLSLDGAPVGAEKQNENGRYRARFTLTTPVATGSGSVAVFTFKGVRPGNASFSVTSMSVSTTAGPQAVAVSGAARITVEP